MNKTSEHIKSALYQLLRPLSLALLRNGMDYNAFAAVAKRAFVDTAREHFKLPGRKMSASRISIVTGLARRDVSKVDNTDLIAVQVDNRAARVIKGWRSDQRFIDASGNPARLALEDKERSFTTLVADYGVDIPATAMRDELLRIGAITESEGVFELMVDSYIPKESKAEAFDILGDSARDLLVTLSHNLTTENDDPRPQRIVEYNNIPVELMDEVRRRAKKNAREFTDGVEDWMSLLDRDGNPAIVGTHRFRAGFGIYYFEEQLDDDGKNE